MLRKLSSSEKYKVLYFFFCGEGRCVYKIKLMVNFRRRKLNINHNVSRRTSIFCLLVQYLTRRQDAIIRVDLDITLQIFASHRALFKNSPIKFDLKGAN